MALTIGGGITIGGNITVQIETGGTSPVNTVAPVVSGTASFGSTLSTTNGTWTGTDTITFTYQWQRNGVNISSATGSTYTLVSADVSNPIRCVVTGTNAIGNSSANSNATANVSAIAPGAPTIGTATATGETTATVAFTAPASDGGATITTYTATSSPAGGTGTLSQAGSGTISVTGLTQGTTYTFTVTATNSAGTSSASSASNSITTTPSYFNYNTLLIPGASTTFVDDASTNNFAVTINGDTKPNNFNPYTPGYYSVLMASGGSSGSYFSCPATTPFSFGTGDFCVESWVYATQTQNSNLWYPIFDTRPQTSTNGAYPIIGFQENTGYLFAGPSSGPTYSTTAVTLNTWLQVVWTRVSSVTRCFVNGVLVLYNGSDSTNYLVGGNGIRMGSESFNSSPNSTFPGYFSNYRVSKGGIPTAYSTSSTTIGTTIFTPSTTPLTTSGTLSAGSYSLLTFQSNRYIDNSSNASTITPVLSPSISSFDPFVPNTSYSTYGSGYFDGTGDYLSVASQTVLGMGAGDFTYEAWIYVNEIVPTNAVRGLYDSRVAGATGCGIYTSADNGTTSKLVYTTNTAIAASSTNTIKPYCWTHVAVTRSGTTVRGFLNGVVEFTYTDSRTFSSSAATWIATDVSPNYFNGYINDARILKGTAVYTTTFTPPSAPLTAIANTSLLTLQNNQSVNNNVFLDNSTNNFLVTRNGNTTQGTFSPYGGNWSNYLTSSNYLNFASSATLAPNTNSFTMEFWYNSTSTGDGRPLGNGGGSAWGANKWIFSSNAEGAGKLGFSMYNYASGSSMFVSTSSTVASDGQWHHIAIVRSANTWAMFIDGVRQGSTITSSVSLSGTSSPLTIGYVPTDSTGFSGYISNFRFVNGSAVYDPTQTTITVPTTPLTAITNTSLLTCADSRFIDDSINNFAITLTGSPSIQRFSPFNPSSLTPTSYSGYFDGTGDYLTTPSSATCSFGTSSLTIEGWFYLTSASSEKQLFRNGLTWPTNVWTLVYNHSFAANKLCVIAGNYSQSTYLIASANSLTLNTWNHIAVVRNVNSWQIYINGVADGSSATWSGSVDGGSSSALFGVGGDSTTLSGLTWIGNISNFRAVNGTAVYTSNFTPSTTPLTAIANTSLLTLQSPTFIDNSTNNFTITAVGNSQPTIQNPFGFTSATTQGYTVNTIGGSGYFDGSDYLTIPSSTAFAFPSGVNFTVEGWVYLTSYGPGTITGATIIGTVNGSNSGWFINLGQNIDTLRITSNASGTWADNISVTTGNGVPLNTWTHIAFVRNGGSLVLYKNGVSVASMSGASTYNFTSPNNSAYIGYDSDGPNPRYVTGSISDVRVVKGTALYTSNFVPSSQPLTAVQNTTLLSNMTSAGVYDAAMMTTMETVADAKLSTAVSKFGGSSVSFDGTGDYLVSPQYQNFDFSTGDFTIELWMYINLLPVNNYSQIVCFGTGSSAQRWILSFDTQTSQSAPYLRFISINSGNSVVINVPGAGSSGWSAGTWYHVAVTRSGNTFKLFRDGVQNGSTVTNSAACPATASTGALYVGSEVGGADSYYNGYIDDLRITKGIARYTSNFTPPTQAFATY